MPVQDQKDSRIEVIRGMISTEVIWPQINNPGESLFYISGPPVMLSSITESLAAKGIARDSIKIDAWE
jgi:Na+-transporting NADH:ubiquinone oxidoreductase subunit NqrF